MFKFALVLLLPLVAHAQFGFLGNIIRGFTRGGGGGGGGLANIFRPQGVDKLFPDDCGRLDSGRGALCFGDAVLCRQRTSLDGIRQFGGKNYYFSWMDNARPEVRNTKWDWFNARNYCRKRCMDLVSFETESEYNWVKGFLGNTQFFWTSGRKCNFDGCDKPEFFPKLINGWFWSANQVKMAPTNSRNQFHDWSHTGGSGRAQPDSREGDEACMAVLNNFYGDGVKWHDVACHHEKPIVCEDNPGHLRHTLG